MNVSDNPNKKLALKILQEKSCFCGEGGGACGYAHIGSVIRLYELGGLNNITHTIGSSVGSILALALACGASPYYIKEKILGMDLRQFEDGGNWFSRIFRFLFKYGLHKGDIVERFVGEILHDLTGNDKITFKEVYDRFGVHLTITYLSTRHKKTKYADHINTPNYQVKTVARWSSTIPLFYQAARFNRNRQLLDLIADGGVADNYPIHVLREQGCPESKILGFKLFNDGENKYDHPDSEDIDYGIPRNIKDYAMRLVEILREQALRYHVHDDDWKLTCKANIGKFKTTDFNMTEEDKMWLYNSGRKAMDDYLKEIEELLEKGEYPY